MKGEIAARLSRRERQILDAIYASGPASAADILKLIPNPPSYSAVRALLRIMEEKGYLRHTAVGGKYVYQPVRQRAQAGRGALKGILKTFFDNSAAKVVSALLDVSDAKLSEAELDQITRIIEKAKEKGNQP